MAECVPGLMCFYCPYPDCRRYASPPTAIEKMWYEASGNNSTAVKTKNRLEGQKRYTPEEQEDKHREQSRNWARTAHEERKAKGLCPQCGKRKPRPGRVCCDVCNKKQRAQREKLQIKRLEAGICIRCGKRPAMPGNVKCKECVEKQKEANLKSWKKRKDRAKRGPSKGKALS